MSEHYYALIMAGGGGTRLWPLSRRARPKQMLKLVNEHTLFQITVQRLAGLFPAERIFIVTTADQASELQAQAPEIPPANYLIEPAPRGTASAIGLAALAMQQRDPKAIMAVLTADHFIANEEEFLHVLKAAREVAEGDYLVTLGIEPTYPATAYGYIQQGKPLGEFGGMQAFEAARFQEKPDLATAEQMLVSGGYTWNSGMFIWRAERILAELERQMPELAAALERIRAGWEKGEDMEAMEQVWMPLKTETIDYGIMEHAEGVVVIPASGLGWTDVGSWKSLFEVLPGNNDGNVIKSEHHISVNSHNSLVYTNGSERLIVTIGVEDLVIVDTGDVLLVCAKDQAQEVRKVIERLREEKKDKFL